jgi:hypothetical protein
MYLPGLFVPKYLSDAWVAMASGRNITYSIPTELRGYAFKQTILKFDYVWMAYVLGWEAGLPSNTGELVKQVYITETWKLYLQSLNKPVPPIWPSQIPH